MKRYNIYLDRKMVQAYNQKGQIKCESEPKAFMEYKKARLFQSGVDLARENTKLERRTYLDKVIILMEKIEDEYRAFEEMEAKQKAMSKKDLFLLQRLGKKYSSGTSQQELQLKRIKRYEELFWQMIDKMINIHSTVEFNFSERKEIDNIYEERKNLKSKHSTSLSPTGKSPSPAARNEMKTHGKASFSSQSSNASPDQTVEAK